MVEIAVGRELQTLRIKLVAGSQQSFGLSWETNSVGSDLTGVVAVIVLSDGATWTASNSGSTTTWTLTSTQTDLSVRSPSGKLVLRQPTGDIVAFRVIVEVQR